MNALIPRPPSGGFSLGPVRAIEVIKKKSGTQLDPDVVHHFLALKEICDIIAEQKNGCSGPQRMSKKSLIFILLIMFAFVGCNGNNPRLLPDELSGLWTTDAPLYQGRFLELSRPYIIVGVGDGSVDLQRIMHVESAALGDQVTYTVLSKDAQGMDTKLIIVFKSTDGGQFQLGSQSGIIWKRCRGEKCGIEDKLLLENH